MSDPKKAKEDFYLNLKQLRHFFDNLKNVHGQHDTTLEKLADETTALGARHAKVHDEKSLLASPQALESKNAALDAAFKFQE